MTQMARTYAQLLLEYDETHGLLLEPPLLAPALHLAYSMGIKRGYYSVGTYVNKPGDHGGTYTERHPPGWAFDLRRKGWRGWFGWGKANAQKLANFYWEHHVALNIEYVIAGDSVISRAKPYWHPLTTGDTSHEWHLHVSGHWPGR